MATLPTLVSSPLNLVAIRDDEQKKLKQLLTEIEGEKCIVIDPFLSKPLNFITEGVALLKQCGAAQIMSLAPVLGSFTQPNLVYFLMPIAKHVNTAISSIHKLQEQEINARVFLFFFPYCTRVAKELLKESGVSDVCTVMNTDVNIYPLDDDILSLEISSCYPDLYLHNDLTSLQLVADAICSMEQFYGVIPEITAIGANAQAVVDMVLQSRVEGRLKEVDLPPEISRLVVIDRSADPVTPFVTPLTYEGLINELLGIECGSVTVSEKAMGKQSDKPVLIRLNNSDSFFQELRDENIARVVRSLNEKAIQVKEESEARPQDGNSTINEIIDFRYKLPELIQKKKFLETHLGLLNAVTTVTNSDAFHAAWELEHQVLAGECTPQDIAALADVGTPLATVVRLLVLWSLVNSGLKPKVFDEARASVTQFFGLPTLLLLHNLQKLGLLVPREAAGNFATLRSRMRLVQDGVDGLSMADMSYVTSGYAPLSGRLLQALTLQGKVSDEIARLLAAPVRETRQVLRTASGDATLRKKLQLVVFVGGVTFTEIAAVRQLKQLANCNYETAILTTNILNGSKIIRELSEEVPAIPIPPRE
ncbi:hypothetical protein WA556_001377 [Blastocystis sp. ATCC 50177/Nand II]